MKKIKRLRRVQLAVPGDDEKKIVKASRSSADQVFCDLEDAVAPQAKEKARLTICDALNGLDWGKKTKSVRINNARSQWCYGDIITLVERAHANLDVLILTKPLDVRDVLFVDMLLDQMEQKLALQKKIGLELLIEDVLSLQNVEALAQSCARVEALVFGMGDYAASQKMMVGNVGDIGVAGAAGDSPDDIKGDIFYYPRFKISCAAHAASIDAVDGPFASFGDIDGFINQARQARALGMVGKWAIHPSQIEPALTLFTPQDEEVQRAHAIATAYEEAKKNGLGVINLDGVMVDEASVKLALNIIERVKLIDQKERL